LTHHPRDNRDEEPTPDSVPVTSGGGSSVDRQYEIATKVAGIERSTTTLEAFASDAKSQLRDIEKQLAGFGPILANLEKCVEKVETKVSKIQTDTSELKIKADIIQPVAISIGRGIWGLLILLAGFVLTITGFWMKHKYGW
jgi:hypothetical protein